MEIVAELNNQGVMLMASKMFEEACQCFETALRGVLSHSSNDKRCKKPRCAYLEGSTPTPTQPINIAAMHAEKNGVSQGKQCLPNRGIIHFFELNMQENELVSDDMSSEEEGTMIDTNAGRLGPPGALHTRGVAINIAALRVEECQRLALQRFQNPNQPQQGDDTMLPLFTLLSAVALFNMALSYHLAGLSKSNSRKLDAASRLYEKSRLLLSSLKSSGKEEIRNNYSTAAIIDMIYMATLNNEGYLAYCQANYEFAQKCFEILHSDSLFFMLTQIEDPSTVAEDPFIVNSSGSGLSYDHFDGDYPDTRMLAYLREKAYVFFLNAICYRNTMMAPAA